jgi:transposase
MPEKRRRYDLEFRDGAVHVVRETGKSIRQMGRGPRGEPGDPGQLGHVGQDRPRREARPQARGPRTGHGARARERWAALAACTASSR